jgi:hypothetical protein
VDQVAVLADLQHQEIKLKEPAAQVTQAVTHQ